jgi:predicted RNA-binding protein (virulence factor B family)
MIEVGRVNRLEVVKEVEFGLYLDGQNLDEILLPKRYIPEGTKVGDELDVFIYFDSDDRIIATTEEPFVQVGEVACLEVKEISAYGAFVDWGLMKDLLVPFKEQRVPMVVGRSYVVYVFLDVTGRIAASSKISRFLKEDAEDCFEEQEKVRLLIASRSELGYKAVINGTHLGLIHNSDVLQPIKLGEEMAGYVRKIREEDGKMDLTLQPNGDEAIDELGEEILEYLKAGDRSSDLTDKSSPEEIYKTYRVSKGNYKRALSRLYKERLIVIERDKVSLA